jgi:dihydrodipicolinate synthase/N-acetylneuraminate lyase
MKRYPASILATCVVPWRADFSFDHELFRQGVRLLRENLTTRLYLFGTAGEGYAVSDRQFQEIVDVFRSEMAGPEDHPMVGVISLSLSTIIERIEFCRSLGIREFQISLPSWGTLNDREVDLFFQETCGRFQDSRFLHYNLPRAGRLLSGDDYARLAAAHENLVAVKLAGGDRNARVDILQKAPALQCYFTETGFASVRDEFECGLLISGAAVNFLRAKHFFAARGMELRRFAAELAEVGRTLHDSVGASGHIDGAFDKLIMKSNLPQFPLRLLPPYSSADDLSITTFLERLPEAWHPDPRE